MPALSQENNAFFILSKEDIVTNNITNLEEAMRLPGLYQVHLNNIASASSGVLSGNQIAIYKNDFPVVMDNNTGYDLRAIPVWDIDRIEVYFSPFTTIIKNSSGMVIKLYTKEIADQPFSLSAYAINTSNTDFHSGATLSLSNKKHTGQVGLNRSFNSPMYKDVDDRGTVINA